MGETIGNADGSFALKIGELRGETGREFAIWHSSEARRINQLKGAFYAEETGRGSGVMELRYNSRSRQEAVKILNGPLRTLSVTKSQTGVIHSPSGVA